MFATWPCPAPGGHLSQENARVFDQGRQRRVLVVPPLFDEHNKMRHQLVEVMRRLDLSGIDSVLPDLPGWNESGEPMAEQTLAGWREGIHSAWQHFGATHVLAVRGGGLLIPDAVRGWLYGAVAGKQLLRAMLRARTIASQEAGKAESTEELSNLGCTDGVTLAGWSLGPQLFSDLEQSEKPSPDTVTVIDHASIGGKPLWLRAEPDEDPEQADALAAIIAVALDRGGIAR